LGAVSVQLNPAYKGQMLADAVGHGDVALLVTSPERLERTIQLSLRLSDCDRSLSKRSKVLGCHVAALSRWVSVGDLGGSVG
jgi:hypothetical protein